MQDEKDTVIHLKRYDVKDDKTVLSHSIVCEDSEQARDIVRTLENILNKETARNEANFLKMRETFFNKVLDDNRMFKSTRNRETKQRLKSLLETNEVILAHDFLNKPSETSIVVEVKIEEPRSFKHFFQPQFGELPPEKSTENDKLLAKMPDEDREATNRRKTEIGNKGEELILAYERDRLNNMGRPDLADKVKRVSLESDSFGYDIESYEDSKYTTKRYIEVKATTGASDGFFLSANEWEKAQKYKEQYYIYFVKNVESENYEIIPFENVFNLVESEKIETFN